MAYFTLSDEPIYQYDTERQLSVAEAVTDEDYVHFCLAKTPDTVYSLHPSNGKVTIPNQLLTSNGTMNVYAYVAENGGERTLVCEQFYVLQRPQPPEYILDPTPVITYPELIQLVADVETLLAVLQSWENPTYNPETKTLRIT